MMNKLKFIFFIYLFYSVSSFGLTNQKEQDLNRPSLSVEINSIEYNDYINQGNTIENKLDSMDVYSLSKYSYLLQKDVSYPIKLPKSNAKKTEKYDHLIEIIAKKYDVDSNLIKAIISVESSFNKNAVSHKGAVGLMQLIPETSKLMGINDPTNAYENISAGTKYLKMQLSKFKNLDHAIAAYNCGPENVIKYDGIPPFEETKKYVAKVKLAYSKFKGN